MLDCSSSHKRSVFCHGLFTGSPHLSWHRRRFCGEGETLLSSKGWLWRGRPGPGHKPAAAVGPGRGHERKKQGGGRQWKRGWKFEWQVVRPTCRGQQPLGLDTRDTTAWLPSLSCRFPAAFTSKFDSVNLFFSLSVLSISFSYLSADLDADSVICRSVKGICASGKGDRYCMVTFFLFSQVFFALNLQGTSVPNVLSCDYQHSLCLITWPSPGLWCQMVFHVSHDWVYIILIPSFNRTFQMFQQMEIWCKVNWESKRGRDWRLSVCVWSGSELKSMISDLWSSTWQRVCVCVWCPVHDEIKLQCEACYRQCVSRKTSCFCLFLCARISCWLSTVTVSSADEPQILAYLVSDQSRWDHRG